MTRFEAIRTAAARAFSANGFASTTMREIARQADASLGSIYYHFESKEEILRAIICDNFRRVQENLDGRLEGIDGPRERLEAFVDNHIRFFADHLDEMRVMSHELDTLAGDAGSEVAELRRAYTRRAVDILARLRPDLGERELLIAALSLFGMLNWTYRWFHVVESEIEPEELARRMSRLFLEGFAEPAG